MYEIVRLKLFSVIPGLTRNPVFTRSLRMVDLITENIDIWTTAQTIKTNGRGKSADNQSLHGIKKLRELILELAVRGKLVQQGQNDEPASVLLERIAKEKVRLVKEGKVKKQGPLLEISEEEKPFELPEGWQWGRLGVLGHTQTGTTPSTTKSEYFGKGYPFIKPANITDKGVFYDGDELTEAGITVGRLIPNGSALMVCIGGSIGKVGHIDRAVSCNQQINAITPFARISAVFIVYWMESPLIQQQVLSLAPQTTLPILSKGKWELLLFPLPPLAEQHRIVAKVDELMALCDQLEQRQTDSNVTHQTLVETLLTTFTDAADHSELETAWQRIDNHFDTLFTTEHSIDQLKQTVLQLAVMGRLVPQDPNDEPASVLLERIAKVKTRLLKEGKIKKQDPLPEIAEEEKPFKLPKGWEWTQLGNLSANIHYGYTASADHGNSGIKLLRITDIQNDSVNWETVPGCEIEENKASDYLLENDDILIARTGGTIGKSYLVENINVNAVFASYLIRVKRIAGMYSPFIKTYLGSQLYWQQLYENSMGTGQPNVNATALKSLVFPIPPLAEQHRIVSKVDELTAICDTLKARINDAQTTQIQLADTIIEQAVV
jgi:type I restriction enzyme, S subunit